MAVNPQGEFAAFFCGKPYGIPSPLEQNRKHMAVLDAVFNTGMVSPPTRLGFTIKPSLHGLVLVSKTARISRPKVKIDGIDAVIKNDQLKAKIDRDVNKDNNILGAAKIIGQDTLEDFARRLAAMHKPITFDWPAKFRLHPVAQIMEKTTEPTIKFVIPTAESTGTSEFATEGLKSKLVCSSCGTAVTHNVAKFCWFNKPRFGGKIFCFECQKAVPHP